MKEKSEKLKRGRKPLLPYQRKPKKSGSEIKKKKLVKLREESAQGCKSIVNYFSNSTGASNQESISSSSDSDASFSLGK